MALQSANSIRARLDPSHIDIVENQMSLLAVLLRNSEWFRAESILSLLLLDRPRDPSLLDLCGYVLCMQGRPQEAERTLRKSIKFGSRQFWTPHKLGDSLRAQNLFLAAVDAYDLALQWGSTSPLTVRNILLSLSALDPTWAIQRLLLFARDSSLPPSWQPLLFWQSGAIQATQILGDYRLAEILCQQGCQDLIVRRMAYNASCARLDLNAALSLLRAEHPDEQFQRLRFISLLAGSSTSACLYPVHS